VLPNFSYKSYLAACSGAALLLVLAMNRPGHLQPTPHAAHKYADIFKAPLGLDAYFDYAEARAAAQRAGKPLLLVFTGHATITALRLEKTAWPDSAILPLLRDKYVVAQLYVDDSTPLPKAEQRPETSSARPVKTLGDKWGMFETTRFHTNYQPFYVVLNPATEKPLVAPIDIVSGGYDTASIASLLQRGLAATPGPSEGEVSLATSYDLF
jgi:hypothetical protein